MKENFDKSFEFVLRWEGGYSNNPYDPGGETKYGVSQRAYPNIHIPSLTIDEAKGIYLNDYWLSAGCDDLPYPMDILMFDTAVNMGVGAAQKLMSRSTGFSDFIINRIAYYVSFKGQVMEGWINRVIDLYKTFGKEES